MTTAVIIIVLVAVCVLGIRSYAKKLKNGCCGAGGSEKKIKAGGRNLKNYPYVTHMNIVGMTCGACKTRVENAFNSEPGFLARVDLKSNTAVIYTKSPVSEQELRQIVERAGYSAGDSTVSGFGK